MYKFMCKDRELFDVYFEDDIIYGVGIDLPKFRRFMHYRQTFMNRHNYGHLLDKLQVRTNTELVLRTRLLSVNDCFWIKVKKSDTWGKVNLYRNSFNRGVMQELCNGTGNLGDGDIYSPEFSYGGTMPKVWQHKNGDIVLRKWGSGWRSEVFASDFYDYLNVINHVVYKEVNGACECACFTSESLSFVPAVSLSDTDYSEVSKIMLLIDCLILNIDRHMGNWGYLFDSDTWEYMGLAPVFDNNWSLLANLDLEYINTKSDLLKQVNFQSRVNNLDFFTLGRKLLESDESLYEVLEKAKGYEFPNAKVDFMFRFMLKGLMKC